MMSIVLTHIVCRITNLKDNSIADLTGTFDIIFVDANKDGYLGYVQAILDQQLLSHNGIIICNNGRTHQDHIH